MKKAIFIFGIPILIMLGMWLFGESTSSKKIPDTRTPDVQITATQ